MAQDKLAEILKVNEIHAKSKESYEETGTKLAQQGRFDVQSMWLFEIVNKLNDIWRTEQLVLIELHDLVDHQE